MAKRGRPRKKGPRTASGRLSRAAPIFDKGTDKAQAKQAQFGTQGCDAIGRAYMAGLLGQRDSDTAKAMLDTARKLAKQYRRAYENAPYQPAIADKTGGSIAVIDHERIKRQEQELSEAIKFVSSMGRNVRQAFDSLVLEEHPDHGPAWVDELIWAKAHGREPSLAAKSLLSLALDPLDILANGG